ncbi:polycystin-1-like protein 2 [Antedon mediterranea]|uniref:polycystin-1-like protein 2 n=1 Tax=Antedon mediterranea TaxID=105859 RepID=UPI003AF496F1
MKPEYSYTYTIVVYIKINASPTQDNHDLNCTLIQSVTAILNDSDVFKFNETEMRHTGDTVCFFSNTVMNSFLSNASSDIYINVRHERLRSKGNDTVPDEENEEFIPMYYNISSFTSQCYYRSSSDTEWHYIECEVGKDSTRDTTQCFCYYLAPSESEGHQRSKRSIENYGQESEQEENLVTVGGSFSVPMNSINLRNSAFTKLSENPVVFTFMTCCLCAYIVIIIWARKEDKRDVARAGITPMSDNDPRHTYKYEITIFTGVRRQSSTTANVSFILQGEKGETGIRIIKDKKRPILQRSGIDSFLMTVQQTLGTLVHLRIWHDNTGHSPQWFLSRVSVKDIQTNRTYYFMLDRWLALEEDDGQIERIVPTAGQSELTSFGHLFHSRTRRNITDSHLWVSVFMRPPKSNFTRCQRTTCCLSLLFCTMMANILFYGIDITANESSSFSFGPVSFSTGQLVIGIISTLMVFPINLIIVQLFRLSRPRLKKKRGCCKRNDVEKARFKPQSFKTSSISSKEDLRLQRDLLESSINGENVKGESPSRSEVGTSRVELYVPSKMKERRKSSLPLPWWCKYVAWALAWMTIGLAFWLTIEVAGEFGSKKAGEWVVTMSISLTQDIFINQPIKVLLLATFYSLVIKSPDKEDDELTNVQLENDEEFLHDEQLKEEDLDDPSKLEEFEKKRMAEVASALPPDQDEIRDQRDIRMKEIKMHEILKEITVYAVFLCLLMGVAFGNIGKDNYSLRASMVQTFVKASYNGKMHFTKVSTRDYFWNYTNNVFLPSLYAGVSYNGQADPKSAVEHLVADRTSSLTSVARLRQLRVKDDACVVSSPMHMLIDNCRPEYSSASEDTRHFNEHWIPLKNQTHPTSSVGNENMWRYKSWYDLGSLPYWGTYALYNGGGYVAELGYTLDDALEIAEYLRSTKWVDQHTRAVFFEFSIFNPSTNLYGVAYMIAEFLPTGGAIPHYNFHPVLLDRYSSAASFLVILCEVCFALFILWYLFREIMLFRKQKFNYFKNASNLLEFIVLSLSLMAFIVFVYRYFINESLLAKREENIREFMNFQFFGQLDQIYYYILGFILFISTIKFLKLLRFNRKMLMLANTIGSCYKELLNFFVMFVIIFASYASVGYMIFFTGVQTYRSIIGTVESLFSTLLGKFDFEAMTQTNRVLGPIFFFSFILMIVFILMNMFLTIINEAFARTRAETSRRQNSLEIVEFMIQRFKVWTGFAEKRVRKVPRRKHTYIEGVDPIQIECDAMSQKLLLMVDKLNDLIRKEKEVQGFEKSTKRPIFVA